MQNSSIQVTDITTHKLETCIVSSSTDNFCKVTHVYNYEFEDITAAEGEFQDPLRIEIRLRLLVAGVRANLMNPVPSFSWEQIVYDCKSLVCVGLD